MGCTRDYLQHHGTTASLALVEELGFTSWQAQGFVPAAVEAIADVLIEGGVDAQAVLEQGDADRVVEEVPLQSLATRLGMSEVDAHAGLVHIAPAYLASVKQRVGGKSAVGLVLRGASPEHFNTRLAQRLG